MSNYGQQPYGQQNPYGPPNPYGQPSGRPGQAPSGQSQPPYGPGQPQQPYGQGQPQPYGQGYPPPDQAQWSPQPAPFQRPEMVRRSFLVVTLDAVPGRVVTGVLGDVVGVVARSRELPMELRGGSPTAGYVLMLTQSRQDAVDRLVEMAQAAGADAVLGLRFDCSEITQSLSEVTAYGTAVKLSEVSEPATAGGSSTAADGEPV